MRSESAEGMGLGRRLLWERGWLNPEDTQLLQDRENLTSRYTVQY